MAACSPPYRRPIAKPVAGTVRVAVNGAEVSVGVGADVDDVSGIVTFRPGSVPGVGASVSAGFRFDVPVRFDTDELLVDLAAFEAGEIPHIPLLEIVP